MMVHLSASGSTVNIQAVLDSVWHLVGARLERNRDLQKTKKGEVQEEKFNFSLSVVQIWPEVSNRLHNKTHNNSTDPL